VASFFRADTCADADEEEREEAEEEEVALPVDSGECAVASR
jgi:hypothetical protein